MENASASTRLSITWSSYPPSLSSPVSPERTSTLVLTSPAGRFVDIRAYLPEFAAAGEFPFEWAFAGEEKVKPDVDGKKCIEFNHAFLDSVFISKYTTWLKEHQKQHHHHKQQQEGEGVDVLTLKEPLRSEIPLDIGYFQTLSDGTRLETGRMENPETGKLEDYQEIWMSVDCMNTNNTPHRFVQLDEGLGLIDSVKEEQVDEEDEDDKRVFNKGSKDCYVFDIAEGNRAVYEGRLMKVGNYIQGVLWDKRNLGSPLSVIRCHYNGYEKTWVNDIEYGLCVEKFPVFDFAENIGNGGEQALVDGVDWTCVECFTE